MRNPLFQREITAFFSTWLQFPVCSAPSRRSLAERRRLRFFISKSLSSPLTWRFAAYLSIVSCRIVLQRVRLIKSSGFWWRCCCISCVCVCVRISTLLGFSCFKNAPLWSLDVLHNRQTAVNVRIRAVMSSFLNRKLQRGCKKSQISKLLHFFCWRGKKNQQVFYLNL